MRELVGGGGGGGGGGGLNCEAKAQVLIVMPPPLFPGSQKGGGVTAGQYGTSHKIIVISTHAPYISLPTVIANGMKES